MTTLGNGIGYTLGAGLVTCKPLLCSGNVWYVHYGTGTDAASPAGKSELRPLKTLSQALTNAADDDIIVLLDGHEETFTAALTVSKKVAIVGAGMSGGVPTAKFTNNSAADALFTVSGDDVTLANLRIAPNAQTNAAARVDSSGDRFRMLECYVECDQYDTGAGVAVAGGNADLRGTTFVSIATSSSARPGSGLKLTANVSTMRLYGVIFDGGTVGFSSFYAFDGGSGGFNISRIEAENISLLRGADVWLDDVTSGWFNAQTVTGGSRIDWSPTQHGGPS